MRGLNSAEMKLLRPGRKQARIDVSARSKSCTASGPALSAERTSTRTICRSRRAKCSWKNGRTTTFLYAS